MSASNPRRNFVKSLLMIVPGVAGAAALWACNSDQKTEAKAGADPCDPSQISENDRKAREKLGYRDKAPLRDKRCATCSLFLPAAKGKECGSCTLFKGPVNPNGSCTYWSPKTA